MHLVDKISKMRRVSLQMSEELGREPTDDELGEEIGIASGKVSQLKTVSIRPASLDAPISDDDSTEFGEIVGDEEAQTPFELLRDKNLRNEVGGLLDVLDDRERKIIFSRFGLDGGKPKTLEEVGKKFGVTRERIRQLQNIALSKLRRALEQEGAPGGRGIAGRGLSPAAGARHGRLLFSSAGSVEPWLALRFQSAFARSVIHPLQASFPGRPRSHPCLQ